MRDYFNLNADCRKSGRFWLDAAAICATEAASLACAYVILGGICRVNSKVLNPTSHKTAFVSIAVFKASNMFLYGLFPKSKLFRNIPYVNWIGVPCLFSSDGLKYFHTFQVFFISEFYAGIIGHYSLKVSKVVVDVLTFNKVRPKEVKSSEDLAVYLRGIMEKIKELTSAQDLLIPSGKNLIRTMDQIDLNQVAEIALRSNNSKVQEYYESILFIKWEHHRFVLTGESCPYNKKDDIISDIHKVLKEFSKKKYSRNVFLIFSNYQNTLIYDGLSDEMPAEIDKQAQVKW